MKTVILQKNPHKKRLPIHTQNLQNLKKNLGKKSLDKESPLDHTPQDIDHVRREHDDPLHKIKKEAASRSSKIDIAPDILVLRLFELSTKAEGHQSSQSPHRATNAHKAPVINAPTEVTPHHPALTKKPVDRATVQHSETKSHVGAIPTSPEQNIQPEVITYAQDDAEIGTTFVEPATSNDAAIAPASDKESVEGFQDGDLPLDVLAVDSGTAEVEMLAYNEAILDGEVIDTFQELSAIINARQEGSVAPALEPYESLLDGETVLLNAVDAEPAETTAFEEFIMMRPRPDVIPEIHVIIAPANDKPLDETLTQLSFYLAKATPDTEMPMIETALQDIIEDLSLGEPGYAGVENKIRLTPQLTQKLLILVEALGYDNPRETLVEFIAEHDFELLIQAIFYMHRCYDQKNPQEVFSTSSKTLTSTKTDEASISRIGKTIVQYLLGYKMSQAIN